MSDKALADAINNLANAIHKLADYDRIGHEICMGIRHGLFGNGDASNNIAHVFGDLEHSVDRIAEAAEGFDLNNIGESADTIAEAVSGLNKQGITTYEG